MHTTYRRISIGITAACFVMLGVGAPNVYANQAQIVVQEILPTSGGMAGQPMTFIASASGFTDPVYALSDDFSGSSISSGDISNIGYFSWVPAVDDAGAHHVTVTVTDAYGDAASTTASLYVIPDTITIQDLSPGLQAYTREPVTFTVHTPGFINPWFIVRDSYTGSTISTADIASDGMATWYPAMNEQGTHSITITALDSEGHGANVTQSITVSPATVTFGDLSSNASVTVGTPVTFSASTEGLTDPTFSLTDSLGRYSSVNANDLATSTGVFSWVPSASDVGTHILTLSAADSYGGTASAKTTVVVTTVATTTASTTSAATPASGTSTSPVSSSQSRYVFTRYLTIGSTGTDVSELQTLLTTMHFYNGSVTGYFGSETQAAVIALQKANNITPAVGNVGSLTRGLLNQNASAATLNTNASISSTGGSGLSSAQVSAVISLLEAFKVDAVTLAQVEAALQ